MEKELLALLIGLNSGLVEAVKAVFNKMGWPKEVLPFLAILTGIGMGFLTLTSSPKEIVFAGIMVGLGSVGLYEFVKQPTRAIKNKLNDGE